jgi:predicted nucleic acid-binding Zn ribbon protein
MYGDRYSKCQNCGAYLIRRQRRFCSVECRDDKGPCGAENCTRPAHAGGLCHTHYRTHRAASRKLPPRLRYFRGVCERKGCEQFWRGFLPNQRFCSRRCDRIAEDERRWAEEARRGNLAANG